MIRQMLPALAIAVIGLNHASADAASIDTKPSAAADGQTSAEALDFIDIAAELDGETEALDEAATKRGKKKRGSSAHKRPAQNSRNAASGSSNRPTWPASRASWCA